MKHNMYYILLLAAASLFSSRLHAQVGYESSSQSDNYQLKADTIETVSFGRLKDNFFASVHLGVNGAFGENIRYRSGSDLSKFARFASMVSAGKFFTSTFGLRGSVGFYRQCGIVEEEPRETYPQYYGDGVYNFWNINVHLDVLINLYHLFYPHRPAVKFNVFPLFGIGSCCTFGFDKDQLARFAEAPAPYKVSTKSDIYPSLRAGLMCSWWLSDRFELQFETYFNFTDDQYNGVIYDRKYDGYLVGMLGVAYKFRNGTRRFSSKVADLNDAREVAVANANLEQARRNLARAESTPADTTLRFNREQLLQMTVSFDIDQFRISDIQKSNVEAVANYISTHPEFDVTICGFADSRTAYPAYNMRLSKRRVMAVYNMLTQQFGVDPKRLNIDYKGDTEQPYQVANDWNRVVVFKLVPHNSYKSVD